jgi:hypothetical protein
MVELDRRTRPSFTDILQDAGYRDSKIGKGALSATYRHISRYQSFV